jgi:NADPH-dependent glutamate synthase beta subunit-like oxidoreductase
VVGCLFCSLFADLHIVYPHTFIFVVVVALRQALVSIGYKGVAIPGTEEWFDGTRGVMKNEHGRVDRGKASSYANNNKLAGLYVSGWLKRGPTGIIGTNITDAKDTVATILHDLHKERETLQQQQPTPEKRGTLAELLRQRKVAVVDWDGVQRIEAVEASENRKRTPCQQREKLTQRDELLQAAGLQ